VRRLTPATAVLGLAAIAASPAAGAGEADDLIERGVSLRRENRDQEALPLFKRAFELQATPRASAQLGLCEQALGLWVPAEEHLQGALAHRDDKWVKKNAGSLATSLARVQGNLGSIEVWGTPEGARVAIDGEAAGTLPLRKPIRVAKGQRTVTVEATGFSIDTQTYTVEAGGLVRAHVTLAVKLVPARPAGAESQPPPPVTVTTQPPTPEPAPSDAIYRRWWFWTLVGAVVIGGGASVYLLTRSKQGCTSATGGPCDVWQ
jgi:hypothetical protein